MLAAKGVEYPKTHDLSLDELLKGTMQHIRRRGVHQVFGTCAPKLSSMYTLFGWEIVDSRVVEGKELLLMRHDGR